MPKFLDQPSWYVDVSGTPKQVWGAPMVEEFVNSSVENGDILSKQVQGGFSLRNLRVNGNTMNDINIYAPESAGSTNQILMGGGTSAPKWNTWGTQKINGITITPGTSYSIYAPIAQGDDGEFLTTTSGMPRWTGIFDKVRDVVHPNYINVKDIFSTSSLGTKVNIAMLFGYTPIKMNSSNGTDLGTSVLVIYGSKVITNPSGDKSNKYIIINMQNWSATTANFNTKFYNSDTEGSMFSIYRLF